MMEGEAEGGLDGRWEDWMDCEDGLVGQRIFATKEVEEMIGTEAKACAVLLFYSPITSRK